MSFYYMAESASEQDKVNPAFLLATWVGNMVSSCAGDFPHHSHKKKVLLLAINNCSKSFIDRGYRAFSLTWPVSMLINWNKRNYLHEKRVQLPEDFLGTPTWPPFHCFGTPIWPLWRCVKTLCLVNMVGYCLLLFCIFIDLDFVSIDKKKRKRTRPIVSHLDLLLGQ